MFRKGDVVQVVQDTASLCVGERYIVVDPCTNPKYRHEEYNGVRCIQVVHSDGRKVGRYYEWKFELVKGITLPEDLFVV